MCMRSLWWWRESVIAPIESSDGQVDIRDSFKSTVEATRRSLRLKSRER